jgi:imidazolonepropionase-like amidohydrolase
LIENVTLIDGTGREAIPNAYVLVDGERFAAVSPVALAVPEDTKRIDGTGKYLIPGLIDSHIHLPGGRTGPGNREMIMDPETGLKALHGYLYSGVTSVYDSGNHAEYIYKMREDERAGRILSPRIFATVSLVAPVDGHGCCAGGTVVDSYEDGVEKLDALIKQKPDLLKFTRERRGMGLENRNLPIMPLDLLNRLITYSNERGVRTTIHVSEEALAREAMAVGVDAFAHCVYLKEIDTNFAQLVATNKIPVSTTMTRYETGTSFFDSPLFAAILTPEQLESNKTNERYVGTPLGAFRGSMMPTVSNNIRQLYGAGAILALGTDRSLGAMAHQELKRLVEAGIPPIEAIRIGTLNAAIYLGREDELGSIERGKLADMVLLNADPTEDIHNTQTIEAVFKGGQQIDRSKLDLPINNK